MATYGDLHIDGFYLIIQEEGDEIELVQPIMETNSAVLISGTDEDETTFWRKKHQVIFEVVDKLTDEQVEEYESLFEDEDEEDDL